jgi:predicted transcriptional regulator
MTTIGYIQDVIYDYKGVKSMMSKVIDNSGYKTSYLIKQLNMSRSAFYNKKRNNSFSLEEIEKIVSLMKYDEDDDAQTIKELDEIKKQYGTISEDELVKLLNL